MIIIKEKTINDITGNCWRVNEIYQYKREGILNIVLELFENTSIQNIPSKVLDRILIATQIDFDTECNNQFVFEKIQQHNFFSDAELLIE